MNTTIKVAAALVANVLLVLVLAVATQPWFSADSPGAISPARAQQTSRPATVQVAAATPTVAPAPAPRPVTAPVQAPIPAPAPIVAAAANAPLTLVSWGGSYQDAERQVFFDPYAKAYNVSYQEDAFNGSMSEIREAYAAGKTWDVLEVEFSDMLRGCEEGIWQRIDWNRITHKNDLLPSGIADCGVGFIVWSFVLVYNTQTAARPPVSWADMWNIDSIPGKRGLRDKAQWSLELALMADGVAVSDVYNVLSTPQGVDRAFAKLDQIKPHVVWWKDGVTPVEMLTNDGVVMMNGYNGRASNAIDEGMPISIVWNNVIYTLDFWVVRNNTHNLDRAYDFINFAMTPEVIAEFPRHFPYGPVNTKAIPLVDQTLLSDLPTAPQNLRFGLLTGAEFWNRNSEALEARFQQWRTL